MLRWNPNGESPNNARSKVGETNSKACMRMKWTNLKSFANFVNLGSIINLLWSHDELKNTNTGLAGGFKYGQSQGTSDVIMLGMINPGVLFTSIILHIRSPLRQLLPEDAARKAEGNIALPINGKLVLTGLFSHFKLTVLTGFVFVFPPNRICYCYFYYSDAN